MDPRIQQTLDKLAKMIIQKFPEPGQDRDGAMDYIMLEYPKQHRQDIRTYLTTQIQEYDKTNKSD